MKVDAVILAGGDGEVLDPACRFKGLFPLAGKPLVEWVVDAFLAATLVNEVAVVMPTAEGLGPWVDRVSKLVVSNGSFMDNVVAGVGSFRADRPVIVATGDIPLVTPEAIDDLILKSLATGADFTYPIVPKADMEEQFPGSVRTYFRLRSGKYTGGNAMLVDPRLIPPAREIGQRLFDQRKNAAGMLRIAGPGFMVRFVLGRLEPQDLADKIRELFGGTGAAVRTRYASIGVDVDKPADVELARRELLARTGAAG